MPVPDESVPGGDEASGGAMHVDEMQELAAELEEVRDRHLRLAAEFDNFRKRTIRERSLHAERAQAELVKELLESLDDLTRVLGMGATAKDNESLLEGVRLVERKLRRALEHSGLKQIEAVGQPFDPELHEALSVVPVDEPQEDGVVADELSKGYLFRDTLLKPALVNVKKYQPKGEGEEGGRSADVEEDS